MITIRHHREADLEALVRLINQADAVDRLERGASLEDEESCFSEAMKRRRCFGFTSGL
ncbi:MAG: hypothetical protein WBH57_07460 [Anaerolineae bacterium]